MACWLVTLNDGKNNKLYKCSKCVIKYKEKTVIDLEFDFFRCPNCGEKITGAVVDHSEKCKHEDEITVEDIIKAKQEKRISVKFKDDLTMDDVLKNKDSIPGIYERYMMDVLDYLQAKFPQLGKDELMDAVGYISSRSMVMVQDTLIERDNMWHKEMDRMRKDYDRELRRVKVSRRDVKKSDADCKDIVKIIESYRRSVESEG